MNVLLSKRKLPATLRSAQAVWRHDVSGSNSHIYKVKRNRWDFNNVFCLTLSIQDNGLPWWLSGKESACQCRRHRFDLWVGEIPWRRKWQPTPVFLPGEIPWTEGAGRATVHGVAKET